MADRIPDLLSVDFAALDTLCRVHAQGSFTRAAETLGVNQSAVSYTVEKLRRVFADPLFVKEAGRQMPTLRCDGIVARAQSLLEDYRDMAMPEAFDPALARAEIVIACNYYERLLVIPAVASRLRSAAPGIVLNIVNSSSDGHQKLLDREADFLLGPFQRPESGFYFEELFEEEYVCLMDRDHPATAGPLTLAGYLALEHVLITYGGGWKSRFLQEIEATGRRFEVAMKVPSPAGIGHLVAGTRLVATVPARLARRIGAGQAIVACPVPAPFKLGLVWTARTNRSPLHRWIRGAILAALDEVGLQADAGVSAAP